MNNKEEKLRTYKNDKGRKKKKMEKCRRNENIYSKTDQNLKGKWS